MNIDKVEELAKKIYGVKITKNPLGNPMYEFTGTELALFAELVWKAAYEEGHDVGVDAGFEAGRNASFTEQNLGVEE